MAPQDLVKDQVQSVATEINFLRLPLFQTTTTTRKRKSDVYDYTINGTKYQITISHDENLTAFDRKVLLVIEYLYLQQNPLLLSNKLVTNFTDIARVLGISKGNAQKIWEALSKLRGVEIHAVIHVKRDEEVSTVESEFNLLYQITRVLSKTSGKRKYTNHLEVVLNDWHVENFRNNYYRIVNLSLVVALRSGIAVRFFDYLNYKAFYYDRNTRRYRQKQKITLSYDELVTYLHISRRPGIKEIKKQFSTALDELQAKGVLHGFKYIRTGDDILLKLHLSRSINWKGLEPDEILPKQTAKTGTPTHQSSIERDLRKYSLSKVQVDKVLDNHSEQYLRQKIDQLCYVLRFASHKVRGQGCYLYQSIIDDWKDDSYEEHLKERKAMRYTITNTALREIEQAYERHVREICEDYYESLTDDEKNNIDQQIQRELDGFQEKIKGTRVFMYEAKKAEILRRRVQIISFQDYCDQYNKRQERDQPLLALDE